MKLRVVSGRFEPGRLKTESIRAAGAGPAPAAAFAFAFARIAYYSPGSTILPSSIEYGLTVVLRTVSASAP
jgi:hypothetical protein